MWKLALLVTSALALKVQQDVGRYDPFTGPYSGVPATLDAAMEDIDTQITTARGDLETYLSDSDANGMDAMLTTSFDMGNVLKKEMLDEDLVKDEIKAIPYVLNDEAQESRTDFANFGDDLVSAINAGGTPMVGISVDTDDLDIHNYMRQGLALPPVPGWEIRLPPSVVEAVKESIARMASKLREEEDALCGADWDAGGTCSDAPSADQGDCQCLLEQGDTCTTVSLVEPVCECFYPRGDDDCV